MENNSVRAGKWFIFILCVLVAVSGLLAILGGIDDVLNLWGGESVDFVEASVLLFGGLLAFVLGVVGASGTLGSKQ